MCYEFLFKKTLFLSAVLFLLLFIAFVFTLGFSAFPSIKMLGLSFFYGTHWNPVDHTFGSLPFLVGTLLTSFLALFIAMPFALATSLLLEIYWTRGFVHHFLKKTLDILASVPSIIYGFWGLFYIVPIVRKIQLASKVVPYGFGLLSASLVLALMILPFCASMCREVIALVPHEYREVAVSLGATRFELIRKIVLPYVRSGIWTSVILALGRALGETMAVTFVIGNSNIFPQSVFSPGNTIASVIASEFSEVSDPLYLSALIQLALLLFVITIVINVLGKTVVKRLC